MLYPSARCAHALHMHCTCIALDEHTHLVYVNVKYTDVYGSKVGGTMWKLEKAFNSNWVHLGQADSN